MEFLPETVKDVAVAAPYAINRQPGYEFYTIQEI
jgi:hypothetical protein